MICTHCKKEIENDSIFCPICGEKIDEIDSTPQEEVKEEVVTKEEEKVKEPKSKVKVKEKARKLYKYIFMLIISIIAFVLPFANLTGYDVFMGSNLITFFVSNSLRELVQNYGQQLGNSYFAIGTMAYILTLIVMALCLVNLVLSIVGLILNYKVKIVDIFVSLIFVISLANATLFGFNGAASVFTIVLIVMYAIGLFVMNAIDLEYKPSVKIVYCVGFGTFITSFIALISTAGVYSASGIAFYLSRIDSVLRGTNTYDLLGGYVSQLILFILLISVIIFSLTFALFYNRKLVAPIGGITVFFLSIIFTITLNLTSTYIIQEFIAPAIMYLLSSILLLVVDVIAIKKEKEIESN